MLVGLVAWCSNPERSVLFSRSGNTLLGIQGICASRCIWGRASRSAGWVDLGFLSLVERRVGVAQPLAVVLARTVVVCRVGNFR